MRDLERAKELLHSGGYTCVLCKDERSYHSSLRGVKPLLDFLESGVDFNGFSAADRVVGAGAAFLYVLLGVKNVWAKVLSNDAQRILSENGINVLCEKSVPYIVNRTSDGRCPIESCVIGISDPHLALKAIREKLAELNGSGS